MENRRLNQRHRTRKDLLRAAAELMKQGKSPSVAEVAEHALVSRATAYRYFPNREMLLSEAPVDGQVPTPDDLFADDRSTDPVARLDKAEAALHQMIYDNQGPLRVMLARLVEGGLDQTDEDATPFRQNRRGELIEAALAPARDQFDDEIYENLCAALSTLFGTESMIVFTDVLRMDADRARSVKRWAIEALVKAALSESKKRRAPR
jgi:AcrR family transcriptional regulator